MPESTAVIMSGDNIQTLSEPHLLEIRQESVSMAQDLISTFEVENPPKAPNKYCETLRRTVKMMSNKHYQEFKRICKTFEGEYDTFQTFVCICDSIFEDKQVNWGRVVAVYAFAAHLANHLTNKTTSSVDLIASDSDLILLSKYHLKGQIANFVGMYVSGKLGQWIYDNGGWDAFVKYFPEKSIFTFISNTGKQFVHLGFRTLVNLVQAVSQY